MGVARERAPGAWRARRGAWSAAWLTCAAAAMAAFNKRDVLGNRAPPLRAGECDVPKG